MANTRSHTQQSVIYAVDYCGEVAKVCSQAMVSDIGAGVPSRIHSNYEHAMQSINRLPTLPRYRDLIGTLLSGIDDDTMPEELRRYAGYTLPEQCKDTRVSEICQQFNYVLRKPEYGFSGIREDDVAHSVALALQVAGVSEHFAPAEQRFHHLGRGVTYALIHDLDELIGGDVATLGLSKEQMDAKASADADAIEELIRRYPDLALLDRLVDYAKQSRRDSRIVKIHDKLTPSLSHTENSGKVLIGAPFFITNAEFYIESYTSTSHKLAKPKYIELPFWLSLINEARARGDVATYGYNIGDARELVNRHSVDCGLNIPDQWVVV